MRSGTFRSRNAFASLKSLPREQARELLQSEQSATGWGYLDLLSPRKRGSSRRWDDKTTVTSKHLRTGLVSHILVARGSVKSCRAKPPKPAMYRLTARLLLALLLAGTFVPVAMAISAPVPHACCMRKPMHDHGSGSPELRPRSAGGPPESQLLPPGDDRSLGRTGIGS